MRACTRAFPMCWWNRNASASAQRCSKEWNPPGVMAPAGALASEKVGMVGVAAGHARGWPQTTPVPRGPNSHL
jgi:hypothetical protein